MTDLDKKLEEIAREIWSKRPPLITLCPADAAIKDAERMGEILELVQAASRATARYCAEIVKAVPERGWDENHPQASWMNGYVAGFDMAAETILRECGVKE